MKTIMLQLFPMLMIASNFGAALIFLWQRDYRRFAYFTASAICVLAVAQET